jgi:uncharacterized protein
MLRYLLPVLAMLFFAPGLARAESAPMPPASFDCTKAPGVDEHVICSDPLLRQADHDLASAYKAARSVATDKARLRADQHGWITQRDHECGIDKFTVVTDANRPRFVDCFLDEYDERMGDLQQMSLRPTADPASISHPIRKSFDIPATAKKTSVNGVPVLPGQTVTAFTWQLKVTDSLSATSDSNNTLFALAIAPDGSGALYSNPGPKDLDETPIIVDDIRHIPSALRQSETDTVPMIKRANVPGPDRFKALCSINNGDILLSGGRRGPFGLVSKNLFFSLPHLTTEPQEQCNLKPDRLSLGDGREDILNFGALKTGVRPDPRFVTLTTPAGTKMVEPPIRIDSRTHFSAYYVGGAFVLYQEAWPSGMNEIMERRWSKSNCAPYYEIDPTTAKASPGCIPFGPYSVAPPKPLVTPKWYIGSPDSDATPPSRGLCNQFFYVPGNGIWVINVTPSFWGSAIAPVPAPFGLMQGQGCNSVAYFAPAGSLKFAAWPLF